MLFSLGFILVAWHKFDEFSQLENGSREYVMVHAAEELLYTLVGKWGVVGLLVVPALGLFAVGMRRLLRDPRGLS